MKIYYILLTVFAILLLAFSIQNPSEISARIFFWEVNGIPLVLIMLGFFISGYLVSAAYFLPKAWKKRKEINLLKKEVSGLKSAQNTVDENDPEGPEMGEDKFNSFFND